MNPWDEFTPELIKQQILADERCREGISLPAKAIMLAFASLLETLRKNNGVLLPDAPPGLRWEVYPSAMPSNLDAGRRITLTLRVIPDHCRACGGRGYFPAHGGDMNNAPSPEEHCPRCDGDGRDHKQPAEVELAAKLKEQKT